MKLAKIVIDLIPDKLDDQSLEYTQLIFEDGKWSTNIPVYSRFTKMMHEVWTTIKPYLREEK